MYVVHVLSGDVSKKYRRLQRTEFYRGLKKEIFRHVIAIVAPRCREHLGFHDVVKNVPLTVAGNAFRCIAPATVNVTI